MLVSSCLKVFKLEAPHVCKIIKFSRSREFHCSAASLSAFGIRIWSDSPRGPSVLRNSCFHAARDKSEIWDGQFISFEISNGQVLPIQSRCLKKMLTISYWILCRVSGEYLCLDNLHVLGRLFVRGFVKSLKLVTSHICKIINFFPLVQISIFCGVVVGICDSHMACIDISSNSAVCLIDCYQAIAAITWPVIKFDFWITIRFLTFRMAMRCLCNGGPCKTNNSNYFL